MTVGSPTTTRDGAPETLRTIEHALARHRAFGDSDYILRRLRTCLESRLDNLSAHLPGAAELRRALRDAGDAPLHHVIGDTVVRCAVLHAHTQIEIDGPYGLPLADCAEVFAATARRVRAGRFDTPLDDGSLRRLGPDDHEGRIWSDDRSDDVFGRSFRRLLRQRYQATPRTPGDDEVELLRKGASLLQELLPSLAPGTLGHAHVVACVPDAGGWAGIASSSQFHLGGTVFLGRHLHNPWWVAEHLFHEALHQKLYDFRHGHSLLEVDLADEDPASVCVPWNSPRLTGANQWDVHRVLAAFHVYAHLGLLSLTAERRAAELEEAYGPAAGMTDSAKALGRAHYLGERLREQGWDRLGPAGRGMVEWLTTALRHLDPSPPPQGAYVHLCLDLYEREADRAAKALRAPGTLRAGLPERLTPLARDEADGARRVLAELRAEAGTGTRAGPDGLDEVLARYPGPRLGAGLPELRRAIVRALRSASPDGYRLGESGGHDESVKRLVHDASGHLHAVLAGYPAAVADAKRRADRLRFPSSCQDDVGRLLTVLAGTVPRQGRILEIGTGAGVGTAWIAEGVGDRTDVEVVTVELDAGLSDAVRAWPWPDHVRVVNADAAVALDGLGTFDLVFADAAPVKYGRLGPVLAALAPGGLLVLDDLDAGLSATETQLAEKDLLRAAVLGAPGLHAMEIRALTGVILASKAMGASG